MTPRFRRVGMGRAGCLRWSQRRLRRATKCAAYGTVASTLPNGAAR